MQGGQYPPEEGTSVFLPGKSHGQRSLMGSSSHGGTDTDMT